jgi:hypothetical protein
MVAQLSHPVLHRLSRDVRQVLIGYLKDIGDIFGPALQSVVLYGSAARGEYLIDRSNLNLLLMLTSTDVEVLRRYGQRHRPWSKERIVVPLMLTPGDLKDAAQLFPLEYAEMQDQHVVLAGEDPLMGLTIDLGRLWLQCRQEMEGNLIRLRQRLVEGVGSPEAIAILLVLSLTTLLPCLRGVLRVNRQSLPTTTDALLDRLKADFDLDVSAFKEIWDLKRTVITPGPAEFPRMLERYLASLVALRLKTDAMKGILG